MAKRIVDREEGTKKKRAGAKERKRLNMANSIIGAGIIGIPYSVREAGFGMGIILLIVLTVVVDWTIRLLIFDGKLASRTTYQDLLEFAFGRPGLIAISIFQFAFAFGGICAYCVIIGDTIPHVIRSLFPSIEQTPVLWIFGDRNLCIAFFVLFVSYPLSLYRDISKLAKTSALALAAIVFITISVAVEGPKTALELRGDPSIRFNFSNNEVFQAIAVISFAFVCHHNSFLIFGSLKQPSLNRFAQVTHWSMTIALLTCMILGLSGYLVFTDKTAGNILNNFPSDNVFINIARLAFGLNMFTTIPLETFVCREVLETFFWPSKAFDLKRHFTLTTILTLIGLTVSLLTCNLGILLELTGAFSATALAYILPPLCYLKLATGSLWHWSKLPHWSCLIFGLVIMFVSSFYSLQKVFTGHQDTVTCDV
ncbi:transmembrane amino acid transporter protein-domain-containing protein [Gongronella butleri]|nr:transmembrane amino acid transporter protein-domain-containing protein [Gongronella butleri]